MNPLGNLYNIVVDIFKTILDSLFSMTGNYAAAIILMTIAFNLLLFPLRINQARGMKIQRLLQPQIDAINEKHKNDKERVSQETMALWQKYKFNPLSGCLPLLLQLPLFFAILEVFRNISFPDGPASSFFWITNISQGTDYILAVFVGVASYLQTRATSLGAPMDKNMQMMNAMTPLLMVFFCWSQPPSLALYWTTNQLFYAGTQLLLNRYLKVELDPNDEVPPALNSRRS